MTQYLPPNLLALFTPRDPIQYLPPIDKLSHEKRRQPYTGIANFVQYFENPEDAPPKKTTETRDERLERKRKERVEQAVYKLEQDLALWNPNNNSNGTNDPYKTLFIARINYDTSEAKLRREFGVYGRIKNIRVIHDIMTNRPRGYAFIEYEDEADMHAAYKRADGKKIDGRRVVVDVERGRTVHGWRPRRLGGGLGGTRRGGSDVNTKYSGRDGNRKETSSQRPVSRSRERRRSRDRRRSRSRRRRSKSRGFGFTGKKTESNRYKSRSRSRERRRRRSRSRDRRKSVSRERRRRHSRSRSKSRKQKTSTQPKPPSPLPDAIVQPPAAMEDGYPVYPDDEYNSNMKYETPNYMSEENNGY